MSDSAISPTEASSSTRINIARSTGQILPIRFVTRMVVSGIAAARISGCRDAVSGFSAIRSMASA